MFWLTYTFSIFPDFIDSASELAEVAQFYVTILTNALPVFQDFEQPTFGNTFIVFNLLVFPAKEASIVY